MEFFAGYASGIALILAGHPFDTVKVRIQTEGSSGRFKGPLDCVQQTWRNEGALAFYKGVTPPLVSTGFINSLLFGIQSKSLYYTAADRSNPTIGEVARAAVITGGVVSVVISPIEGIKTRLQVQYGGPGAQTYAGPIDCAKKVYQQLGVRNGLYRGWLPTCLCRMSNYAYFGPYEYMKRTMGSDPNQPLWRSMASSVGAGATAGVCYWTSCYPLDVIKNKIQAAKDVSPPVYSGMRQAAQAIYADGGLAGFFRGFTPCIVRSLPANAAAFSAYELVMYFSKARETGETD